MLKTVRVSSNSKLGKCAATYRAGVSTVYGTCPNSCPLKPEILITSNKIDEEYLRTLIDAVPKEGVAWTYTHFNKKYIPISTEGKTCINISTDSIEEALETFLWGYPTVVTAPSTSISKYEKVKDIKVIRCPAEYLPNVTCFTCGGRDKPLCARHNRDFIVKFTAHGNKKKLINQGLKGGCYGNSGPVRLQWQKSIGKLETDSEKLKEFVSNLPAGTKLRHHVVGDIGK